MNRDLAKIVVLGIAMLLIPPLFFPGSRTMPRMFQLIGLLAILALALNIVFGHTDQLLLFTGAMAAIGGYVSILLANYLGVSPWATILVGALLAGGVGALVTFVAARRGLGIIVIAIITLALQFSFIELINHYRDITGGATGLRVTGLTIPQLSELPLISDDFVLFYIIGIILLALMGLYYYLMHSKYGLAFEMIRQDQGAAESIGVDVVRYKVLAGFIATFTIGLAGPFFGQRSGFLSPGTFEFIEVDVLVLIMLVVGGLRTMYGPLVGAAVIVWINRQLRDYAEYRSIMFGVLLIVLFLYFRQGIVPQIKEWVEEYELVERSREVLPISKG